MKETIKSAAASFSARRMVKQYVEKFYSSGIKHALED
jgi:starch phosphorylase